MSSRDFAAAALVTSPFAVAVAVCAAAAPPADPQWARADPILLLAPRALVTWGVPALGAAVTLAWCALARLDRATVVDSARRAAAGAALGVALTLAVRGVVGDRLPAFVPAEESAAPGLTLSLAAGYVEEVLVRLGVLPLAWQALGARGSPKRRALLASAVAALAFAALHRLGDAQPSMVHFATRLALPGFAFSVAALRVRPAFVVAAHAAAHLLIPSLFAAPP